MKIIRPSTILMMSLALCLAGTQNILAFSPILSVDHWGEQQLKKAGITVKPWKHALQGEDPPMEWVEVSFDASKLPKDQDVIMTAWIISGTKAVSALRADRAGSQEDRLKLIVSAQTEVLPLSYLDVFIWTDGPNDSKKAHGYKVSVKRLVELTRGAGVD